MSDIRALVQSLRHTDYSGTADGTYRFVFRGTAPDRQLVAFAIGMGTYEEARTFETTKDGLVEAGRWATAGTRHVSFADGYQITDPDALLPHASA